ncbi:MAG: ATP-dependent Clp protease ATP-binding subunit [Candidatus Parcubacteria bacterium]|nr:ATP-dependent Clp protease ATP-binding subunit [Candidatus Parcubacteria bacterium]
MFDFKESTISKLLVYDKIFLWRYALAFKKLFLAVFILLSVLFFYGFLMDAFIPGINARILGLAVLSGACSIFFFLSNGFFEGKIKNIKLKFTLAEAGQNPENYNLADLLSFESAAVLKKSAEFAEKKKTALTSTIILYFLLNDPKMNFIFFRLILDKAQIKKTLKEYLKTAVLKEQPSKEIYSADFMETISESLKSAFKKEKERIEIGDLLIGLAKSDLILRKIIIDNELKPEDIENMVWWVEFIENRSKKDKLWWETENLSKRGTLAKEWTAGYTLTLDQFSNDWSDMLKKRGFPEIIGHQKEIEQIERILESREEINNVLIVGEQGMGRKNILEAIAKRSFLGQSLPTVNYKRIVALDIPKLLTRISDFEQVEQTLDAIFQEILYSGNIVLVIEDFHNFIGDNNRLGSADIAGVLSPYLKLPNFQVIAITTFSGLHKDIEKNPSLLSLFGKVEVSELSDPETLMVMENEIPYLEHKHKIFITYPAMRDIIFYCERYLPALSFPEKAIDILEETAVYVSSLKEKILLPKHVAKIITEKSQIPVGKIEIKEKEILLNLENLIHQRIINQEEAVVEVSAALRRARAEVTQQKGPMGGFLFFGPTGVGKTETAKALAAIYFGSESRMITLDMSEFQSINDIPRLIGSLGEEGILTTQVRENPFSLILLDEIEKAHPNILNLFLQVLDEGRLTDGFGRKVDFKNSIIIATSNAGYKIILKALEEDSDFSKVKGALIDSLFQEGIFRPEFINRFDAVVVFKPLSKKNLLDIAGLMFNKIVKGLKGKGIEFLITEELKEKIVELSYDPKFGAREMKRVIQDNVENVLANAMLSNELKKGNSVKIDPAGFKLIINPEK